MTGTATKKVPERATIAAVADAAAISPATWLQPSAAIRIGNGARENRKIAAIDPDTTEANSSAAAAPAPSPTSMICIIFSCPASSAVRDGSRSVPTIAGRTTQRARRPGRPLVPPSLVRWRSVPCAPSSARRRLLADHIGQQSQKAGAFDGPRQLPLLLGGHRCNPTRHDLATLGDIALQEPHVFVVDLRRIGAGKRTGLAAAKEWPTSLRWRKRHGRHSSLALPGEDSS